MPSPAGTYVISASDATGRCTVTINFDPAQPTRPLIDRGSPARCLVADNTAAIPWPYYVKSPQGLLEGTVPVGHTDLTASQIRAQSGITDLSTIEFGLARYVGG